MDIVSKISDNIEIIGETLNVGELEFSLTNPSFSVEVRETTDYVSNRGVHILMGISFVVCVFFAGEYAGLGCALILPLYAILLYVARGVAQSQTVEVNFTDEEKSYRCFLPTMQAEHLVAEIPTETFEWKYWPRNKKRSS